MRHHAASALQDLVVLLIVGLAVAYLVRRLMRNAKGHADCGCGDCAHGGKKAAAADSKGA